MYVVGEIGIQEELTLAGFDHTGGPEDGTKQITLGMGAKMEHDENVCLTYVLISMK